MKRRTTLLLSSAVTITALFSFNSKVQAAADPTIKATNYNMIVKSASQLPTSSRLIRLMQINDYYLVSKNSKQYNKLALMTAQDSFHIFTKKIGKYPYKEIDITEGLLGKDTGGMEYPGLIMIDASGFLQKKNPLDRYNELTEDVSHEVGHQWFYGTVGSDEYMEPWLDEGLTNLLENGVYDLTYTKSKSYCAKLMHSKFYTRKNVKRANKILKENANQFINKNQKANYPVNNPPKGVDTEDMAYELGMDFPAVLKVAMGENKFFDALHDYYQTYYLKQATTQDFLNIISKYDNSKKVNNVINKFIDPKYLSE